MTGEIVEWQTPAQRGEEEQQEEQTNVGDVFATHSCHEGTLDAKEKLGGKLSDEDKETIEKVVDEKIKWLEDNKEATTEELQEQKKEMEGVIQPIISKLYQGAGGEAPQGEGEAPEEDDTRDEL